MTDSNIHIYIHAYIYLADSNSKVYKHVFSPGGSAPLTPELVGLRPPRFMRRQGGGGKEEEEARRRRQGGGGKEEEARMRRQGGGGKEEEEVRGAEPAGEKKIKSKLELCWVATNSSKGTVWISLNSQVSPLPRAGTALHQCACII